MNHKPRSFTILMADDNDEGRHLAHEALREGKLTHELRCVVNGQELLDYLHRRNRYAQCDAPRPGLILLDLNMPRPDGREVLAEIKRDPELRQIPIVVLTSSRAQEDVFRSYDLGVNSYIVKPMTFDALVDLLRLLGQYWFELVELPPDPSRN